MRASTEDSMWAFVAGPRRDMAKLILSLACGVKVGKGDLREASKEKLLEVGLELRVLRADSNKYNMRHWGVIVDKEGVTIAGGGREAVRRGLVTEENCEIWWGLWKNANGDVYDRYGIYGESNTVYGRTMEGMAVPT